jgi:hypothetical protein
MHLVDKIIAKFMASGNDERIRTMVSLLQALCRSDVSDSAPTTSSSGSSSPLFPRALQSPRSRTRFGMYIKPLEKIVEQVVREADEDETREGALSVSNPLTPLTQCLESFILKNPSEMSEFIPGLILLGLQNLKHDPNYVQDLEESEIDMPDSHASSEASDEEDDFEQEEYSDDDDISWKVRRAAAKLLSAIIISYPDVLGVMYRDVAPVLISRFSEREESVRVEILATFRALVHVTGLTGEEHVRVKEVPVGAGKRRRESSVTGERPVISKALGEQLRHLVPRLSRSLTKVLNDNSVATKLAGITLARELIEVLDGGFDHVLPSFVQPIRSTMDIHGMSKSGVGPSRLANESNLKIESLRFIKAILKTHSPVAIGLDVTRELALVDNKAISTERFYKVVAEALETVVPIITALVVLDDHETVYVLSETVKEKVLAADLDQEVREKAIVAMGVLLKTLGPQAGYQILFDRLKTEAVRLVTVKVIAKVIDAIDIPEGSWIDEVTQDLSAYLRRTNREVKVASLKALHSIITKYGRFLSEERVDNIVDNLCALLTSEDIQLYPSTLDTFAVLLRNCTFRKIDNPSLINIIVALFDKPQLQTQGLSWASYARFLDALATTSIAYKVFGLIQSAGSGEELDSVLLGLKAKSLAAILASCGPQHPEMRNEWENLKIPPSDGLHNRLLRLWLIGEAGKLTYLLSMTV